MQQSKKIFFWLTLLTVVSAAHAAPENSMALIPGGTYIPLYFEKEKNSSSNDLSKKATDVTSFWLDRNLVTNRLYLEFIKKKPFWKKSQAKLIFTDSRYLQHWRSNLVLKNRNELDSPVVNVSWFAAMAYCEAQGKRLPSTDEWEYALNDDGRDSKRIQQKFLDWYSVPNGKLQPIAAQEPNGFGIYDLIGLVWEWTLDFNSFMVTPDSRDSDQKNLFCGGGSLNSTNAQDYASFMRYSFRASLQGAFTSKNLGFRCAKDIK